MIPAAATNMQRRRDGARAAPVTQIELFFGLVFVFAVTQLSHGQRTHLSPLLALAGFTAAILLFVAAAGSILHHKQTK